MKKVIASSAIILSFIVYVLITRKPMDVASKDDSASNIASQQTTPEQSSQTATTELTGKTGQFKDGEYTGPATDFLYGNIQVKATISGGKLTDVEFLQYPTHHESARINEYAMPILKQEAIQAQSARVDVVSRATDTSYAFMQSLAAALREAQS
jgi:uncharacterized protein with FMN-binding domain